MALIPVWRGVGGGPAGCCAANASRPSAMNNGRAGGETTVNTAISSGRSFVCAVTSPLHEISTPIARTNTSKRFRMTPPLELEIDRELDLTGHAGLNRPAE